MALVILSDPVSQGGRCPPPNAFTNGSSTTADMAGLLKGSWSGLGGQRRKEGRRLDGVRGSMMLNAPGLR